MLKRLCLNICLKILNINFAEIKPEILRHRSLNEYSLDEKPIKLVGYVKDSQ